ncbi:hypothetical protein J6590_047541 [Homalodisca vitripennis]|nr:hypothetical protein J6590_047541 [Homalodisca vitripennis]
MVRSHHSSSEEFKDKAMRVRQHSQNLTTAATINATVCIKRKCFVNEMDWRLEVFSYSTHSSLCSHLACRLSVSVYLCLTDSQYRTATAFIDIDIRPPRCVFNKQSISCCNNETAAKT